MAMAKRERHRVGGKPTRMQDPNWLPSQWMKDHAVLRCEHCGDRIKMEGPYWMVQTWEEGEQWAKISKEKHYHGCSALGEAKRQMQVYRERHPNITFDEATEIYKLILEQLTVKK